jgi:putative SOS response-associated peptidase YedK
MRRHRAASFDRFVSIPNPNAISDRNRLRNRVSGTYLNEEILGLLEVRRAITSFAIVTTDAAPSVAQYHNRMPVVLEDSQFDEWMRGTTDQAAALMKPYAGAIEAWEVGADVGNVKNNRPELMDRVGLL